MKFFSCKENEFQVFFSFEPKKVPEFFEAKGFDFDRHSVKNLKTFARSKMKSSIFRQNEHFSHKFADIRKVELASFQTKFLTFRLWTQSSKLL